ncbi:MAG: helix-turn-helix transcriptional regulator [Moraxellaceae bacterium]|nr:helix-turn-helix transcriptional regulator [Moraxellaceae bacterium]
MTIGALLKKHRLARGLTLEAVALEAGTDPGNLSRIERDAQEPSAALLRQIARALGVTVSGLYGEMEATPGVREVTAVYDRGQQLLQRRYAELTPENRLLVMEFIKMLGRLQKSE